ncbi:MAG: ribonuclease H-like domain-containing protein [Candidatus Brocadiia bacterium]
MGNDDVKDEGERWRKRLRRWLGGRREAPRASDAPPGSPELRFDRPVSLEELLEATPEVRPGRLDGGGWALRWSRADAENAGRELASAVRRTHSREGLHDDLAPLAEAVPEDLTLFDLETLGLGNAGIFLIGCLRLEGGRVAVEQFLAADYSEEPSLVGSFAETLRRTRVLVSFNGKSYDLPLLTGRAGMWHVDLAAERLAHHLDILYECRRRWSGELPDCRLQTLELRVCGRRRRGDLPGAQIPATYHEFVETRDARLLAPILRHNVLDLVTMAEILRECLR